MPTCTPQCTPPRAAVKIHARVVYCTGALGLGEFGGDVQMGNLVTIPQWAPACGNDGDGGGGVVESLRDCPQAPANLRAGICLTWHFV